MTMTEWAENEVKIACKREREESGVPEGEFDYGSACYESALKAYKSLTEDGHSGMSFSITKQILNRLMDHQPLTPIEDTDDIWYEGTKYGDDEHTTYQCKRMSSLFKDVYEDGTVEYHDVNRVSCVDINSGHEWHNGMISGIIHEMFPITMPYYPSKGYAAYFEDFLSDPNNGDYDTKGILYVIDMETGEKTEINKFFGEVDGKFVEITKEEYEHRRLLSEEWRKEKDNG